MGKFTLTARQVEYIQDALVAGKLSCDYSNEYFADGRTCLALTVNNRSPTAVIQATSEISYHLLNPDYRENSMTPEMLIDLISKLADLTECVATEFGEIYYWPEIEVVDQP